MEGDSSSPLCILHVDCDPTFPDLVATMLEREDDQFIVLLESSAADGLAYLYDDAEIDFVGSDYEMPRMDKLEIS